MPDKKLELSWDDYVKKNAAFSKQLTLGIKSLKLDPKLEAQILVLTRGLEVQAKAAGKKAMSNNCVDLKKVRPMVCKAQSDAEKKLNKMLMNYEPPKPPKKPEVDKKNWGKIKVKHGPFEFWLKPKLKGTKVQVKSVGAGVNF